MFSFDPQPDEAEAAAALAAIQQVLAEAALASAQAAANACDGEARSRWDESSRLAKLGLRPQRVPVPPRWATIERIRRTSRG